MLNPLSPAILDMIEAAVAPHTLCAAAPSYLREPRGRWRGQDGVVARPRTAPQIARIIEICAAQRVGVIPYGGGTGLVSGQIMPQGPAPLILSLDRMHDIRAVYPDENVLICEAGAVLADVQKAADEARRLFGLSLASQGSSQVGGLLATNAGGTGVLRYGNARDLCLGIEAVLPDGTVLQGLTRLRKDNAGYDLRNLLIGSEGTLGIITAAALTLSPRPHAVGTALMVTPDPAGALALLSCARDVAGDDISAFELIHCQGMAFLRETMPDLRLPWHDLPEWCVLIELGVFGANAPYTQLERIFEIGANKNLVTDGIIAQSAVQANQIWHMREHIPEANRRIGSISSHDISLPLGAIPDFIACGNEEIARLGDFRINCFGHLGDGNLHYNVFPPRGAHKDDFTHMRDKIKYTVHDLIHARGGSVSAEHGVGRAKVADLEHYGDPVKLAAMRALKNALDPHGIMNPGAILRAEH